MMRLVLVLIAVGTAYGQPLPGRRPLPRRPPASSAIERFSRMPESQRQRLFEGMPPERRRVIEERIEQYQRMTPEERESMRQRLEAFESLPAEQQERARRVFRRFMDLPLERRRLIQDEVRSLEALSPELRRERINSPQFEAQFPLFERRLMWDMRRLDVEREGSRLSPQDRNQK
jgi:hypothetical protein